MTQVERLYGQFEEFMTPDEAKTMRDVAGIVTVTMLQHSNPEAVAARTGLDADWLEQKRESSYRFEEE